MLTSAMLAVVAAFLGVTALFLLGGLLLEMTRIDDSSVSEWMQAAGWVVFLALSLVAAATPFIAWNRFHEAEVGTDPDPAARARMRRTGWMMAIVAVPWWISCLSVLWDAVFHFQNVMHSLLQLVLAGGQRALLPYAR